MQSTPRSDPASRSRASSTLVSVTVESASLVRSRYVATSAA
jgi:hypothetical protein